MAASPWLDRAPANEARAFFTTCCGSTRWVERMLLRRPFGSDEQLFAIARAEWFALTPDDWREAFQHHPKIGDRQALRVRFPTTAALSEAEQGGVAGASDATLDALADGNREYEKKFGYIFIVCATGKSADEMLALLQARLANDPRDELLIAAGEQAKITELRLLRSVSQRSDRRNH
jgi:2-oxo-4-hydroxy-4-carboxy-5-ureidoimidazoline decarboxylase